MNDAPPPPPPPPPPAETPPPPEPTAPTANPPEATAPETSAPEDATAPRCQGAPVEHATPAEPLEGGPWTPQDGTTFHKTLTFLAEERLDDRDRGVCVEREVYLSCRDPLPDGKAYGNADLVVNRDVVDFKTHDMFGWSVAKAAREGHDHGEQVRSYLDSPMMPEGGEGFIVHTGRLSADPAVNDAYARAAESSPGMHVLFAPDASPDAVVDLVKTQVLERDQRGRFRV